MPLKEIGTSLFIGVLCYLLSLVVWEFVEGTNFSAYTILFFGFCVFLVRSCLKNHND